MQNLTKLPTWGDKTHIYAVVETPRGNHCKLEFDPKLRVFTLAKPLMAGLTYPYDWGFIPSTLAEDGDPLDILVIHDAGTYPGNFSVLIQTYKLSRVRTVTAGPCPGSFPYLGT